MEIENLAQKVKDAKEAVECLEEPLKTEAFKKILDKILETPPALIPPQTSIKTQKESFKRKKTKTAKGIRGTAGLKLKEESEKKKQTLADKLNRSHYPLIYKFRNILSRSLYILKIMKEKEEKNLTPPEIQFILKEVFGIKESSEAISVALNRNEARRCTARKKITIGRTIAYSYEIMREGEIYLEDKGKEENSANEER